MGKHYRADTEEGSIGFLKSLWNSTRVCQWIEPSVDAVGEGKGVFFYRNRNGVGLPPQKIPGPEEDGSRQTKLGKMGLVIESDSE